MPLYACQTVFCQTRATDGKPGGRDGLAQRVMPTHEGPVYGGHARTFSLTACLALFPMHVAASPCWMVFIRLAHRRGVGGIWGGMGHDARTTIEGTADPESWDVWRNATQGFWKQQVDLIKS